MQVNSFMTYVWKRFLLKEQKQSIDHKEIID